LDSLFADRFSKSYCIAIAPAVFRNRAGVGQIFRYAWAWLMTILATRSLFAGG
jgi:hypothetical protein